MTFHTVLLAVVLAAPNDVDFDTDVLPILTRAGCNSGACHGSAAGRGGFKLSLFGGDPAADHRAIVLDLEGRRVNLTVPERSLVLRKPLGEIDHEGGTRLESDSPEAGLVARWIAEGARREQVRRLTRLHVKPAGLDLENLAESGRIRVTAEFSDGSHRDVTSLAVFSPDDPASVTLDSEGRVRVARRGRFTVAIRFLTELQTVQVTVPLRDESSDILFAAGSNWIDHEIAQTLAALHLAAAPAADDGARLRRLRLDLTGRLPDSDELARFCADRQEDKYERLVDRLLESDEFLDYWTYRTARWLQIPSYLVQTDRQGASVYRQWLRGEIARDAGWDQMVRELILSTGDSHQIGPANFHRQANDARGEAELLAGTFLGIELRCANCHNHPLDRWTQDDYHGLAAIFARLERGRVVGVKARGEVTHPATGTAAVPRLPGERFLTSDSDARLTLATWLTSPDNALFRRAIANRVWKELMGRGLVEPVDGIRATNPGPHPKLLDRLAVEFAASEYRLRALIRLIVTSATYQRSSHGAPGGIRDDRFYSQALVRPIPPEVLIDAVFDVTGAPRPATAEAPEARAVQMLDPTARLPDFAAVNGCAANVPCLSDEVLGADLATRLQLINGEFLNGKITAGAGRLAAQMERGTSDEGIVVDLYARALSRPPTREELQFWKQQLGGADGQRLQRTQDFLWSLLSSREFTTNH